jgi:phage-related minor tail protein
VSDFVVSTDRAIRVSGEFDYLVEAGSSTLYYGEQPTVSASSNLGSVTAGNVLSRRAPSWVISAGKSGLKQQVPAMVPAGTALAAPAGGTGATAGAYDTAANRDALIASHNALIQDVAALRTYITSKR